LGPPLKEVWKFEGLWRKMKNDIQTILQRGGAMKKFFYLLICLTLAACGSGKTANISSDTSSGTAGVKITAQSILTQMEKGKYVQGELLVKFKPNVAAASVQKIHRVVGASVIKKYSIVSNLERVKLPQGLSVRDAVIQYMSDPDVEYAEPNYIVHIASVQPVIPSDTYFDDQWPLRNIGKYANGTYGADIKAALAWNITAGNGYIKIAVVDTGIDYSHPDLVGNIWAGNGYNFVTCAKFDVDGNCEIPSVPNDDPMDDNGHGTHVAGIIGARGDNNLGVTGVMWHVNLMAIKVLNADGEGSWGDIEDGIQFAIDNGARVINASFGGYDYEQSFFDVVSAANSAGILLVAAAGIDGSNNDVTPFYPASFDLPNVISVAATDQNDELVAFSNFGPNSVDIAAPGTYIISTVPTWWATYEGYGDLEMFSGTSMSTAFVSGVAGLLMSYYDGSSNTNFTVAQIRDTILGFADHENYGYPGLATLKGKIKTEGRLDAFLAVASLATPSDLVADAKSPGLVDVTWSDNSVGEDGFKLERSTNGTTFSPLVTLDTNSTSYEDESVTQGTTYYYRIKAFNWIGESFYSNTSSTDVPRVHHSEGGGCSVGGRQNVPTAVADVVVLLLPVAIVALVRRRR
jgi:subtilisin family serine protease